MSKIPKLTQPLTSARKNEILNQLYINAFEFFKKNSSRKDKKNQEIKEACILLKDPQNFSSPSQIKKYSLLFAQPLENINLKILEKILLVLEEVIMNNLVDNDILYEMIEIILQYLSKFSNLNDDYINIKILNICYLIYSCDSIAQIHIKTMKKIVTLTLHIFISSENIQCQASAHATLSNIIDYMMKKLSGLYLEIKSLTSNKEEDTLNVYCENYLNYLVDIIDINNNDSNKDTNLVTLYLNDIKEDSENSHKAFQTELQKKAKKKETEYGYCFNCRNNATKYSDYYRCPLCDKKSCEASIMKMEKILEKEEKMQSSIYRQDFITTLYSLTKLSIKEANEEIVRIRNKEFCLSIIGEMLNKGAVYFQTDKVVISIIKEKLIDSLVTNTLSNEIKIFKISFSAFLIIIRKFRDNLKDQIEIFINKVMIGFLESENLGFVYKEVILDGLIQLASDCNFFIELYVNFDCDINYKAIFSELMNLVTKIINGMYKKSKYNNTFKQMQESKLRIKSLDFIMKFIKNLSELVEKNVNKNLLTNEETNTFNNDDSSLSEEGNNTIGSSPMNIEGMSNITAMWNVVNGEIKDKINQNLKMKALLSKSIDKFNIFGANNAFSFLKTQKMIYDEDTFNSTKEQFIKEESHPVNDINIMQSPFISNINPLVYFLSSLDKETLLKTTYEDFTAFEMARFIRSNINELNKNTVGEYLCGSKKFNIKVLHYFIYSFSFKGMHILEALRSLFNELYLIGEGQIVDRVVQVFGERYHKENPNLLKNPDLSYYIAFSIIILNTDLHREEVSNKMTLAQYKNQLFQLCPNEKVDEDYLADLYKRVLSNPLVMPGQKISSNKTKKELIKIEKDNIMRSTVARLQSITNISHNYISEVSNDDIKRLMESTWSNFLSIFSQLISFETDLDVKLECVRQLLLIAKICGMLHLDTITEAFINTVVNITNIIDGKAIDENSLECIREMMIFLMNNGKYIRTCWFSLLSSISKIDYYQTTPLEEFVSQIKKKKNIDINTELANREMISKSINDTFCVSIFAKTESFDEEAIMNFVDSLCRVSIEELTSYTPPRVFSLHKLGEVADFNLIRIQIEWVKIWKLISNHLIYVITNSTLETIWSEALESLRQIVSKLLQKEDLSIYNFQNDFFKPFDIIFQQTKNIPKRSEMVMLYIYHIIGSYAKNIRAGWNVIFNILKNGIERNDVKMNEDIKCIIEKIYEDFSNENKIEGDNIKGFIECLCRFSDIEKYKVYCKEIISKVISIMLNKDTNKKKKSDVINMILYGFNDKYFDMMFEVIKINQEMMLNHNDINDVYYGYFKPMIVMMIINNHIDRNVYYDITQEEQGDFVYSEDADISTNVINALSMKNIESEYVRIINDKLNTMSKMTKETYKKTLLLLISQFKDIFINKDNIELFNDIIVTLHSLSYYDKFCDVIYEVMLSINAISMISESGIEKISSINERYLSILSKSKIRTQDEINDYNAEVFLIFNSSLIEFIFSFINSPIPQISDNGISSLYHKCSSIIKRHLHFLISDTSTLPILSLSMNIIINLQKIKAKILIEKSSLISSSNPLSTITLLQKLYQRVQAEKESLSVIIPSIVTEIKEILIHYIKKLDANELETLFDIDIDFSDVDNESLRRASKELLKMYIENELCKFTSVNKQ